MQIPVPGQELLERFSQSSRRTAEECFKVQAAGYSSKPADKLMLQSLPDADDLGEKQVMSVTPASRIFCPSILPSSPVCSCLFGRTVPNSRASSSERSMSNSSTGGWGDAVTDHVLAENLRVSLLSGGSQVVGQCRAETSKPVRLTRTKQ